MQANRTKLFTLAATCVLAVVTCPIAVADDLEIEPVRPLNYVGLAVANVPDYIGSDDYVGKGAPLFRYQFKDSYRYFSLGAQAKLNLVDSTRFRAGPVLAFNPGRQSGKIEDQVVKKMKSIGPSTEAGLFGEYWMIDSVNARDRANVSMTVLMDTGGGSNGMLMRFGGTLLRQASPKIDIILGVTIEYANHDYMQTYFGVNAGNVGTSGLSFFNADSGVDNVGATLGGLYYINKSWLALGLVRYSQLQGDAADSPVVDQRGDDNQWLMGVGAVYLW